MTHMRLWAAAAIIGCVVVGWFLLSVPLARDGRLPVAGPVLKVDPSVTVHDTFKKGVHTISGTVRAPDACARVSATAALNTDPAMPSGIIVSLTLDESEGLCLEVPTQLKFTTTVAAPAQLRIQAMVNGALATTTVL